MKKNRKDLLKIMMDAAKDKGYEARIRDVAYAILKHTLGTEFVAYSVCFGSPEDESDVEDYDASELAVFLESVATDEIGYNAEPVPAGPSDEDILAALGAQSNTAEGDKDITFEENKAAMVELIERTEKALEEGSIDLDKGLKIIADLRVKLNDKFGASEDSKRNVLILPPSYDMICKYTQRECFQMNKEYAMKKFDLIEKPKRQDI
jgi:hypothetical protein